MKSLLSKANTSCLNVILKYFNLAALNIMSQKMHHNIVYP